MSQRSPGTEDGLKRGLRDVLHGPVAAPAPSDAAEPCAACGDETAVGSVRYSDRHDVVLADGSRTYLCGECHQRARVSKGRELTEADLRTIAGNGLLIGVQMLTGGH